MPKQSRTGPQAGGDPNKQPQAKNEATRTDLPWSRCKITNVLLDLKYPTHLVLASNKPKGNTSTKLDDKYTENLQSSNVNLGTLSGI